MGQYVWASGMITAKRSFADEGRGSFLPANSGLLTAVCVRLTKTRLTLVTVGAKVLELAV